MKPEYLYMCQCFHCTTWASRYFLDMTMDGNQTAICEEHAKTPDMKKEIREEKIREITETEYEIGRIMYS